MRIPLRAWYFTSTIDEKKIREVFKDHTFESQDPIVIRFDGDKRALITSYGAVVFWPYDEKIARDVTSKIAATLSDPRMVEEVADRLVVEARAETHEVSYNEIRLAGEPSFDQMRIIALLLAQSVSLEHLEIEADAGLERFSGFLDALREKGRLRVSERRVLKNVGFAMHTRHSVLANLSLFDKPPETWDDEALARLHNELTHFFDLPERHQNLTTRLDFLAENTSLLFEVLSTRKSHNLEWIIIILIAIEIVFFVYLEMFG